MRQLGQMYGTGRIDQPHPADIGRHVRNHKINGTIARLFLQQLKRRLFREIAADHHYAAQGFHFQEVQRNDLSFHAHYRCEHLRPAAGRRAQVDHRHARAHQLVLFEDFQQLVGRARTIAVLLRATHVDVGHMLVHPCLAGPGARH